MCSTGTTQWAHFLNVPLQFFVHETCLATSRSLVISLREIVAITSKLFYHKTVRDLKNTLLLVASPHTSELKIVFDSQLYFPALISIFLILTFQTIWGRNSRHYRESLRCAFIALTQLIILAVCSFEWGAVAKSCCVQPLLVKIEYLYRVSNQSYVVLS